MSAMVSSTDSSRIRSRRSLKITVRWSFITLSNLSRFLRMSKLRASTFCCAFSSALLMHGWMIASFSLRPSFCSMPSSLSEPKMRIRSSSSDRKNLEWPGSPWRPLGAEHEQPAGGERLLLEARDLGADLIGARAFFALARILDLGDLLPNAHVGIAAELDVGAATGHVGGNGDRARYAGLRDDKRLLLVIAGVEDGEHLGLGGAVVAGIKRGEGVRIGEVVRLPAGLAQHLGELLGFLD